MSELPAADDHDKERRIAELIQTLRAAEHELQELTGGEIDAVAGAGGRPYLLQQAQEQLRKSEAAQRQLVDTQQSILDSLSAHIALLDSQGVIVAVNEAWRRFGSENEFAGPCHGVGMNYLDVCRRAGKGGAADALPAAEGICKVLTGELSQFEMEYSCPTEGQTLWFRLAVTPTGGGKTLTGAVVTHHDITPQKRAELERQNLVRNLGERVRELRTLYDVTRLLAEEGTSLGVLFQQVAEALRGAMQFSEIAAVRVSLGAISGATAGFPGAGAAPWSLSAAFDAGAGGSGAIEVMYLEQPPGMEEDAVFLEEERCLIETVSGQIQAWVERRQAADALRLSEASMAEAQRIAHFGSWELSLANTADVNANTLRWSDETFRIAGFEPGAVEVSNELFFRLVPPEEHAAIRAAMARALEEHTEYKVVHRMVRPGGEVRVVNEIGRLFFDEATGQPVKMIGTVHDITEQRRAEEARQRSEEEQRGLLRQLETEQARLVAAQRVGKVGSWEADLAPPRVSWSEETHRIFETDAESFQPGPEQLLELVHPADRDVAVQAFLDSLQHGEPCALEHRLLLPGGRVKHVEQHWQMFFDAEGAPVRAIGTCQDITERRQVSEEMEQTAALLRAVADGTPDAIFVKDLQGRYQFFNEGAARFVGRSVQEVLGRDDTVLFPPAEALVIMENDRQVIASGQSLSSEETATVGGVCHTFLANKAPYYDSSGRIIGVIGISRDITERKKLEHRLAVLSTLGRELNTATTPRRAAEIIAAAADDLLGWDAMALDLYDAEQDLVVSVMAMDTVDGARSEFAPAASTAPPSLLTREILENGPRLILRPAFAAEGPGSVPEGRMFGDLERRSLSLMFVRIGHAAEVTGVLSVQSYRANAYDRDDLEVLELLADYCDGALNRIQTESLRQVSEERFREMADNIGDVFYSYDPEHNRLLYANRAFERLWGRPLATLNENPLVYLQYIHAEDRAAVEAAVAAQFRGRKADVEFRTVRPDGELCWIRNHGVPVLDEAGRVKRIVGTMRDITESRVTADRLAEQAALLDKAQDAILVRDLDDRVLYWNKSAERLYGWTAQETLGRAVSELLHQDAAMLDAAIAATLTAGEWSGELVKKTKAGGRITVEAHWSLVRDEKGHPKSILTIDTDVTARKAMEQQYLRAQRMESIGTLAGGIAHDLNNVLTPILMSIELLRMQEKMPRRLEVLSTIEDSARRGADMVRQVLSFARGVEGRQLQIKPGSLLAEVGKIVQDTFPKNLQVRVEPPEDVWLLQGDPTQLHQVLLNLCVNARDAMPEGGSLTLSVDNVMLDEQYAGTHIDARPGPHVRFCVEDTGCGMPPEVVERIFEPFFTTKEPGKGTGLGLSSSLAIVKSHGGFMRVYSEPGTGTRFHVCLPAHAAAADGAAPPVVSELPRGSGQLVLVIDDEAAVRHITAQTLEAFGYRVALAADGAEATALYASRQHEIDVVLTDMMMPLMDGPATIHVLTRMNRRVRIIAASGLNANGMVSKAANAGVNHFIPKPYTAETLLRTLKQVLEEPAEG